MYNRTPYNKTTYNRTTSIVFEWLATANAETDTSATLKIIRYLDGSAAAVATASGVFVRVLLPSALAEAEAGSVGDYIRTLFFSALAEAVATASGTGVSTYGSVTMVIEGVNMVAGDELIIDTEHMTVTLNGANIIDRVSDDSAFFKLQPGENDRAARPQTLKSCGKIGGYNGKAADFQPRYEAARLPRQRARRRLRPRD